MAKAKIREKQTAYQYRNNRSRRPRKDNSDSSDHDDTVSEI